MKLFCRFFLLGVLLSGCSSAPPGNPENICDIFSEKRSWYKKAKQSEKRWGTPVPILLAFAFQESSFRARAKPPRKKILGFIPGPRQASAYGYVQAINPTWKEYKKKAKQPGAKRDDFGDAMDFVGWYNDLSHKKARIAKTDAYNLYLAYHEGRGGFLKGTYESKDWLKKTAGKVAERSESYRGQLKLCEARFSRKRFLFF